MNMDQKAQSFQLTMSSKLVRTRNTVLVNLRIQFPNIKAHPKVMSELKGSRCKKDENLERLVTNHIKIADDSECGSDIGTDTWTDCPGIKAHMLFDK